MSSPVATNDGRSEPKYVVAKRAFAAVIDRLERFTLADESDRVAKRLDLAVVVFKGSSPVEALPMGSFDAAAARQWLNRLGLPDSGTPLGDAMMRAGLALQASNAASKHLLVLTDGENTSGSDPVDALTVLQKQSYDQGQPVFVHVLALDIPPRVFASLQKAGASLVGAADEKQLQTQLDFILENQILVEAP